MLMLHDAWLQGTAFKYHCSGIGHVKHEPKVMAPSIGGKNFGDMTRIDEWTLMALRRFDQYTVRFIGRQASELTDVLEPTT